MSRTSRAKKRELHNSISEIGAVKSENDTWCLNEIKRLKRELLCVKREKKHAVRFDRYLDYDFDCDSLSLAFSNNNLKGKAAI